MPKETRNLSGVSVDSFKNKLDSWLTQIPDQPTIPGHIRQAQSNSPNNNSPKGIQNSQIYFNLVTLDPHEK